MLRIAISCLTFLGYISCAAAAESALSHGCTVCHGRDPMSSAMPDLYSLSSSEIASKLRAFRDQTEDGTVMPHIAAGLKDPEIDAVSEYFGMPGP